MKKFISALLAGVLLAGCSQSTAAQPSESEATEEPVVETTEETESENTAVFEGYSILSPSGAPAISLVPVLKEGNNTVDIVGDATALQAAMVNPEPEYDVIVAPTNLGVKLAVQGASPYKLLAVVTWGNLYIVGSDENDLNDETKTVAAFSEQAVPGLVFKKAYGDTIAANVNFGYASAQETMAALLSGAADAALIAEPAATAAIAKGKEAGKELKIISDVQEVWGGGFPMAAIFVKEDVYAENKDSFDALLTTLQEYRDAVTDGGTEQLVSDINELGFETFGVPSAEIIGKTYTRLNINVVKASEVKEEVDTFLEMFGVEDTTAAFAE